MAENKKSFVAYVDWRTTFNMLTDEEAGQLIKHLFAYVNDEDPVLDNRFLTIAFEQIKLQLKRDLLKYEQIKKKRSEAGKQGGIKSGESRSCNFNNTEANEANASFDKQIEANEAVNVSVNDNVTVNDNDILLKKETKPFNYRHELFKLINNKQLVSDYMKLRKTKKASNTETAFNGFVKECNDNNFPIEDAVRICIERSWQGFKYEWVKPKTTIGNQNKKNEQLHF